MVNKPVKSSKTKEKLDKKKVTSKKTVKKPIGDYILDHAYLNPDLLVITVDKYSALLSKKKVVTVHEELCPGTMSPVERIIEKTFFHTFLVQWGGKVKQNEKLEEIGFPITFVETPEKALYEIRRA